MITRHVEYTHAGVTFRGYLATASDAPKPCVLVAHPWVGRGEFVLEKARYLAGLGYAGFAAAQEGFLGQ